MVQVSVSLKLTSVWDGVLLRETTKSKQAKGSNQMVDRSEAARALAKAIAFKNCGKDDAANEWAIELVRVLECGDILKGKAA